MFLWPQNKTHICRKGRAQPLKPSVTYPAPRLQAPLQTAAPNISCLELEVLPTRGEREGDVQTSVLACPGVICMLLGCPHVDKMRQP